MKIRKCHTFCDCKAHSCYTGVNLIHKFVSTSLVINRKSRGRPRTIHSDEISAGVSEGIAENISTSIRHRRHQLSISGRSSQRNLTKTCIDAFTRFG